jgi:hypothetical protein
MRHLANSPVDIDLETVTKTVCDRDAAVERIRIYLQRVLITVYGAILLQPAV